MSIIEEAKKFAGRVTGIGLPDADEIAVCKCRPEQHVLRDDGETPNNQRFALLIYRQAVALDHGFDPAAIFEVLFERNGWGHSWRNSIYDFLHFHTHTHEVLGIARGSARVQFGGKHGPVLTVNAGDVIILPAGTGHERIGPPRNLLVVGAYPLGAGGGKYDEPEPADILHEEARRAITAVPPPASDPVFGMHGPLARLWR